MNAASWSLRKSFLVLLAAGTVSAATVRASDYEAEAGRILAAAGLTPDDTVMEIGPGLGVLTRELARRVRRVIAVELDDKLAGLLTQEMRPATNVTIINGDILKIAPATLLPEAERYKVVANLPYYITSPVLRHFLEASLKPDLMVVMVQKEVAGAIAAGPGKRSLLSISVQFYGRPTIISKVPAGAFYPAPEVDSAILLSLIHI